MVGDERLEVTYQQLSTLKTLGFLAWRFTNP